MGRATRWLRGLLGGKKDSREHKEGTPTAFPGDRREKKRWSFKSARESGERFAPFGNAAWLRSLYAETEKEQSKHAIAVAAATAAAADAAMASAHAAVAVVQLTSHGHGAKLAGNFRGWLAAVKIQRVFRGYLAKKALRALKALVKLQALVRGYLVRKQAAATFHSMQALIKAQATIRAQKCRAIIISSEKNSSLDAFSSQRHRLSASLDNPDSPKIVQVDSFRPKSRSSRKSSYSVIDSCDETFPNSMSSPLSNIGRIAIAVPDHRFPLDKCRHSSTAQSTPRGFTPSTPVKSVCGMTEGDFRRRFIGAINCPNYMSKTRSFEAKVRSQSAPKQRPEAPGSSRRLPLSELVVEQSRASLSSARAKKTGEEFSFKRAVVGRLDRSLELSCAQRKW